MGECMTMTGIAVTGLLGAWPGQRAITWIAGHPLETLALLFSDSVFLPPAPVSSRLSSLSAIWSRLPCETR